MAAMKKILKEGANQILPITRVDCVVVGENQLLNQVLADMEAKINGGEGSALANYMAATNAKILALENANKEGGAVANAIKEAKDAADAAQGTANNAMTAIGDADSGLVKDIADLKAADAKIREDFAAADAGLDERLQVVEASIGEGGDLEKRVDANEAKLDGLKKDTVQAAIDAAETAAKADAASALAAANAAQADADALERRLDNDGGLVDRLVTLEGLVVGGEGEGIEAVIGNVAKNTAAIATLNGDVNTDGSVDKKVAAALATAQGAVDTEAQAREAADNDLDARLRAFEDGGANAVKDLAGRVSDNENAIAVINGTGEGSIKKAIADLVDGAPEATNTLNELAQSIANNKSVYDGWVAAHEKTMAQMKTDLQDEIDADVLVEANRAKAEEAKIRGEFAAADAALKTELEGKDAALKSELQKEIDDDVAAEKERAEGIEQGLRNDVDKLCVQCIEVPEDFDYSTLL